MFGSKLYPTIIRYYIIKFVLRNGGYGFTKVQQFFVSCGSPNYSNIFYKNNFLDKDNIFFDFINFFDKIIINVLTKHTTYI